MTSPHIAFNQTMTSLTQQPGSPFEVQTTEIHGVNYKHFSNAPNTLHDLVAPARDCGAQEFIAYLDERWSFDEFFERVDQLAYQLANQLEIRKGQHVAIAMRNYPEWLVAFTAIARIGAVVVPLNSWGNTDELRDLVDDSQAELVICDQQRYQLINPVELGIKAVIVRAEHDIVAEGCMTLKALLEQIPTGWQLNDADISGEDVAMIMYTSGTSGRPKGAVFTHRACCQAVVNLEAGGATAYMTHMENFNQQMKLGLPSKGLLAVPLFHVSGLYSQFLMTLRGGRGLVLMYKWDPVEACRLIKEQGITSLMGAPSMMLELTQTPEFETLDRSAIISVSGGGAATPPALTDNIKRLLPNALPGAGWGMTESGGAGCSFSGRSLQATPTASGFISPIVDLRFFDESGNEVDATQAGKSGEIWIKSPTNVDGYWQRPEASASDFNDGWFITGDVGYLDEHGCLHICDRIKDIVIRGGENIYPIEIENLIQSIDGVVSVAAFAVPSESLGEEMAVVIRCAEGSGLNEQKVVHYCKEHLAGYKVPSFVRFTHTALAINATNKLLKKQIRNEYFPEA